MVESKNDVIERNGLGREGSIKVEIHFEDSRKLPFGKLASRIGIAIVLSYVGEKYEVASLM